MEYNFIEVIKPITDAIATLYDGRRMVNNTRKMSIPDGSVISHPDDIIDSYKTPSDGESFQEITSSGRIKMTDYSHYKRETYFPVVKIPYLVVNRAHYIDWYGGKPGSWNQIHRDQTDGRYNERTNYFRLISSGVEHRQFTVDDDLLNEVMSNVVRDASQTLDLLTEFYERASTIETVVSLIRAAIRPLQSFKDKVRRLLASKPADLANEIANLWLQYRYAISPLIYSIQDAIQVLEEQEMVFLKHNSMRASYGVFPSHPGPGIMYDTGSYTVKWSATSKARYGSNALIDRLGFDPLTTAWELIPYSFVVDWFINVGDYINAKTFSLYDFSEERKFCVSTKIVADITTQLDIVQNGIPREEVWDTYGGFVLAYEEIPPVFFGTTVVRKYREKSYVRRVFTPAEIDLDISPYMDWKRYLDSISLAVKTLINNLKRLR